MSKFISNIKKYLELRGIRQNYISLMTGWNKSKVSRILNGDVELKDSEMNLLAEALGHEVVYFLDDSVDKYNKTMGNSQVAFFAGQIEEDDKLIADKLIELFRFYDALTVTNI